jgi:hypothetical protein
LGEGNKLNLCFINNLINLEDFILKNEIFPKQPQKILHFLSHFENGIFQKNPKDSSFSLTIFFFFFVWGWFEKSKN